MSETTDPHVLLIHGSMHGAWCWDSVIDLLEGSGLSARAIDLPGHGRRESEAAHATMAAYADAVIDAVDGEEREIVLVGHSMSGQVVARAATNRPDRIRTLVFVNAQVLCDGQTHMGTLSPERQAEYRALTREQGGVAYRVSDDDFHSRWLQDLSREDPRVVRALTLSTPQPLQPLLDAAVDQDFAAHGVRAVYLRSTQDVSGPPARTEAFLRRLPAGTPVHPVDGGHDCMISAPESVAAALAEIVTRRSVAA